MTSASLSDLFVRELIALQDAERQLMTTIRELARAAASADLRQTLQDYRKDKLEHVLMLQDLLRRDGRTLQVTPCHDVETLIEEEKLSALRPDLDDEMRDQAVITAARHLEQYDTAGYECAHVFARQLGDEDAAALLEQILDDEEAADRKLLQIAIDWLYSRPLFDRPV